MKKEKSFVAQFFILISSPIFLSNAELLRARLIKIYHNNDDTRVCSSSLDVRTFSPKQNRERLFLDVSITSEV